MRNTANFNPEPEDIFICDIEIIYLTIDFLINLGFASNANEAKKLINTTIYFGEIDSYSLGEYYVDVYGDLNDYIKHKEQYMLYHYVDHQKLNSDIEKFGISYLDNHINCEALGNDLIKYDDYVDTYYSYDDIVFSRISDNDLLSRGGRYYDPDLAEYCYDSMKQFIDDGYDISSAAKEVAKGVSLGEAA